MNFLQAIIAFFGRLCLSLIFISSGIHKIFDWSGTEQVLTNALCDLQAIAFGGEWFQFFLDSAFPLASELIGVAAGLEILGGLLILLGIQVRFGAFLLILFLIPATLLFHQFWGLESPDRDLEMIMFMKNLSILGGLLLLLAFGKGPKSKKCNDRPAEKS